MIVFTKLETGKILLSNGLALVPSLNLRIDETDADFINVIGNDNGIGSFK